MRATRLAVVRSVALSFLTLHALGCGEDDAGLDPSPADDPALVGTWKHGSAATDTEGMRRCEYVAWILHFGADQVLQDSTFTVSPDDPHYIDDDPNDICEPILLSATMRSWSVPTTGVLVVNPGFGVDSDADTLDYEVDGSELRIGLATFTLTGR